MLHCFLDRPSVLAHTPVSLVPQQERERSPIDRAILNFERTAARERRPALSKLRRHLDTPNMYVMWDHTVRAWLRARGMAQRCLLYGLVKEHHPRRV